MAKLAAKDRKKVEKAEATGGFALIPPGKYIAALKGVDPKNSSAGNPMWVAEFEEIHDLDGNKIPGRQWYNMNLPTTDTPPDGYAKTEEKWLQYQGLCAGRVKAFYEAFGYTTDSDTDEMIGDRIVIQISIRTIQNGPRKGEDTNGVENIFALDTVEGADQVGGREKDSDDF